MRWHLLIEEYSPDLRYIKGTHNIIADVLSRLELEPSLPSECDPYELTTPLSCKLAEAFAFSKDEEQNLSTSVSI